MPFRLRFQNCILGVIGMLVVLAGPVPLLASCPPSTKEANPPCDSNAILAVQLALRSETLRLEAPQALEVSTLLAAESVKLVPTSEGYHALRAALSLLRKPRI